MKKIITVDRAASQEVGVELGERNLVAKKADVQASGTEGIHGLIIVEDVNRGEERDQYPDEEVRRQAVVRVFLVEEEIDEGRD